MTTSPRRPWAIRVAAGPGIGWGHVARCVALAELAIEAGVDPPSVIGPLEDRAAHIVSAAGLSWVPVDGPASLLAALRDRVSSGSWLVLDDYAMTPADATRLRTALDCRVMAFDDQHVWDDPCIDAVLAPSAMAEKWTYHHCRAFTGPRYMPMRAEIRRIRPDQQRNGCLVALGGAASEDQVKACTIAAAAMPPVRVAASAGISPDVMAATLRDLDGTELLPLAPNLAPQLASASVCICSGGLVKYEALALGCLPVVVGGTPIETADTDVLTARGLVVTTDTDRLAGVLAMDCTSERLVHFRTSAAAARVGVDGHAVAALIAR